MNYTCKLHGNESMSRLRPGRSSYKRCLHFMVQYFPNALGLFIFILSFFFTYLMWRLGNLSWTKGQITLLSSESSMPICSIEICMEKSCINCVVLWIYDVSSMCCKSTCSWNTLEFHLFISSFIIIFVICSGEIGNRSTVHGMAVITTEIDYHIEAYFKFVKDMLL